MWPNLKCYHCICLQGLRNPPPQKKDRIAGLSAEITRVKLVTNLYFILRYRLVTSPCIYFRLKMVIRPKHVAVTK
jgi:hypothetical protein